MTECAADHGQILVVDDDLANRIVLHKILARAGYELRQAGDGVEALEMAREALPDLILLDIMMPRMGGLDACRQLKVDERTRDIPVIFLSALGDLGKKMAAFSAGGVDYMTKPFQMEEVLARVRTHMALRHLQRDLQEQNVLLQNEISERRRTEATLRQLSRAVEQSASTIVITDRNGIIEFVNPAFTLITGYLAEEAIGRTPRLLKSGLQSDEFYHDLWATILRGDIWEGEFVNKRRDGTLYWERATISPVRNDEGQISHFVAVKDDITQKKLAEAELHESQAALRQYATELEAQNEELDAFAHTVAHDLKNPLNLLIGYSDLLERYSGRMSTDDVQRHLRTICQTGHKMAKIIEELLLLASVRKTGDVKTESLDMASIVGEAQSRVANMTATQQAEITVPGSWPAAAGYAPWVEEVWENYISNGLKYGGRPNAGVPPHLELGSNPLEGNSLVRFWVRDNGEGLTPEQQAALFTPFTRLGQARTAGYGLGLSIARRIIEKLGGTVGVEGEVGQGSTFWFTLPVMPAQRHKEDLSKQRDQT